MMEGVPTRRTIDGKAAVGMDGLNDSNHKPHLKHHKMTPKQNGRPPEGNEVEQRLHHVCVFGTDSANVAPFVVLAVDESKEFLVMEQSVRPVKEGLVEQVEDSEVAKQFA